jgi:hypothetical protein
VFSSLFNIKLFKTRLLNISQLMPINLLNFANVIVSIVAMAGFGLVCASSVASQTQYYMAIVAIVFTAIGVISTLWSFVKSDDFFEIVCKFEESDGI